MNLIKHLKRQMAFSRATFGPGERRKGVCDHIRKEISEEILPSSVGAWEAADEWRDVVLLALDGYWRALDEAGVEWDEIPENIAHGLAFKQGLNEQRNWPDWRTADPDKAIEHVKPTAPSVKEGE